MRGLLHQSELHGASALVSAVNLTCVSAAAGAGLLGGRDVEELSPLWGLLAGNVVSMLMGARLMRIVSRAHWKQRVPLRRRLAYLLPTLSAQGALYMSSALVAALLGSVALAQTEASRVIASPAAVVIGGAAMAAVPRAIRRTGAGSAPHMIRRAITRAMLPLLSLGVLYTISLWIANGAPSRLLHKHVPLNLDTARSSAYSLDSVSNGVGTFAFSLSETRLWLVVSLGASASQVVILVLLIPFTGVFALPLSQSAANVGRLIFGVGRMRDRRDAPVAPAG